MMRRILFLSLLLSSAFGVVVLAAHDQSPVHSAAAPSTQESGGKPINKNCPIETDNAIDPKITINYKGKTIGFCCADCIKEFNKDPEKYLAKMK